MVEIKKDSTFDAGGMAEWSIAAVLKTVELRGSGGSNPSPSAKEKKDHEPLHQMQRFFLCNKAAGKSIHLLLCCINIFVFTNGRGLSYFCKGALLEQRDRRTPRVNPLLQQLLSFAKISFAESVFLQIHRVSLFNRIDI